MEHQKNTDSQLHYKPGSENEVHAELQEHTIYDQREVSRSLASLQQKVNQSSVLNAQVSLQQKANLNASPSGQNPIQRVIYVDGQSNQTARVTREVQSLIAANKGIKEMHDGDPLVRIKMVNHEEEQGHRGFTRYEGEALYIELEEDMVDGVNLRETLHHELLNHGYKMYKHLEYRAGLGDVQRMWDNWFPAYEPSELVDHMAYISETVDKAFGHNIIDQWYTDVDKTYDISDDRLTWMLNYLDRFLAHVLERGDSIYGILNGTPEGRGVMETWGIDVDGDNPHAEIEAVLRKETASRKREVAAVVPSLIV